MMGSSWGMRVWLLTPRVGIAGGPGYSPPALGSFRYVSWALAVWGGGGGVGMWLLPQGRKVFKAASVSVLHTLCARGPFLLSCCASEGLPCPAAVEGDFLLSALAAKQRPVLLLL